MVTGATGYIASHIVRVLLEQGFTVRATVRDPSNTGRLKVREKKKYHTRSCKKQFGEEQCIGMDTRVAMYLHRSIRKVDAHHNQLYKTFFWRPAARVHVNCNQTFASHNTIIPIKIVLSRPSWGH